MWTCTLPSVNLGPKVSQWENLEWVGTASPLTHWEGLLSSSPDGTTWTPWNTLAATPPQPYVQVQLVWKQWPGSSTSQTPTISAVRLTYRQTRAWTLGSYVLTTNPTGRTRSWTPMTNSALTQNGQYDALPINPSQTETLQVYLYDPTGQNIATLASNFESALRQVHLLMTDDRGVQHYVTVTSFDRKIIVTKENGRAYQGNLTIRILS